MSHVVRPVKPTTTGELPTPEFAQLSEEDLQQIIGGNHRDLVELTLDELLELIGNVG